MKIKTILLAACAAFLMHLPAQAAIIVSGPIQTTGGTVEITQPFSLTITTSGTVSATVLDNWVATPDGSNSSVTLSPGTIDYRINGGTLQASGAFGLFDNNGSFGDVTVNDGYFYLGNISVSSNDTLTFEAQNWTTSDDSFWNPQAIQNFSGNVFVSDTSGNPLSDLTAVPEPATYAALVGILALGFVTCRRRARK